MPILSQYAILWLIFLSHFAVAVTEFHNIKWGSYKLPVTAHSQLAISTGSSQMLMQHKFTEHKSDHYRRWKTRKPNRITPIIYHMSCCCRETMINQVGRYSKVHFLDWPESADPCCKVNDWLSSGLWLSNSHLSLPYSSTFVFPPWRLRNLEMRIPTAYLCLFRWIRELPPNRCSRMVRIMMHISPVLDVLIYSLHRQMNLNATGPRYKYVHPIF